MRLFVDANVLFSAAHRAGNTARDLFDLAAEGLADLVSSSFAIEEARRNIALKVPDRLPELESLIAGLRIGEEPTGELLAWAAQYLPPKDAPILAAAVHAGAERTSGSDSIYHQRFRVDRLVRSRKYSGIC